MPQRLTLESLEVLDAIDRKGSFAAAAAALYRVPSALTYSVRKLEQDLGVVLFQKEGRRSILTPAGRLLLEQGRELLLAADRLVENTRQLHLGWESRVNIAIDSILTFDVLYPHLQAFYALQPEIEINLYEEVLAGAWEAILDRRVDLVIGAPEPTVNTQGLRVVPMGQVDWAFCVARDHPLSVIERPLQTADLKPYRVVVVRDSVRHMPPQTYRVLDRQPVLRVATIQQKIEAQRQGLGVGFLPAERVQAELACGDLVRLTIDSQPAPTPLNLVWRADNAGRALRWFVQQLAPAS